MKFNIKNIISGSPIVFFHEFHKPPYGGGNQFLLALKNELELRGLEIGENKIGRNTKVMLINSFNFDFEKVRQLKKKREDLRIVHRIDGPIGVYRDSDIDIDKKICALNNELADATIFQSQFSFNKHLELNLRFKDPTIINNAVNDKIFNRDRRKQPPQAGEKIKIIASAWSDNPRKGGPFYEWLDKNLDPARYEFTFVGRIKNNLINSKHIPALPSEELAKLLKNSDIYITASQEDPCSNALIEALACGLPAVYFNSGGHPELVREAGAGFNNYDEALLAIEKVAGDYSQLQSKIDILSMKEAANRYMQVLKI